jgi:hypothetical protein
MFDWIERLLHVSPDGGTGMFEALYLFVACAGVATVVLVRRGHSKQRVGFAIIEDRLPKQRRRIPLQDL